MSATIKYILLFASLEIVEKQQNVSAKTEVTCKAEDSDKEPFPANLNVITDSSASNNPEEYWVHDDDILQRKLELRESKISNLLRKQEGLLQTIEKMATKTLPTE